MNIKAFLFLLCLLKTLILSISSFAQETKSPIAAFVQYVKGEVTNPNGEEGSNTITYQDLVLYGESIRLKNESYIKLVTKNQCIFIFYGPGVVKLPTSKLDHWNISQLDTRFICKEAEIKLSLMGRNFSLSQSEFFYSHDKISFIGNAPAIKNRKLKTDTVYNTKDFKALYKLNTTQAQTWFKGLPVPKESKISSIEKPPVIAKSRWYFEMITGGGSLMHKSKFYDQDDLELFGIRFVTNFLYKGHSLLGELSFNEMNNYDRNHHHICCGPLPSDVQHNRLDSINIALGKRFNHQKNWSFDAFIGLSLDKHQINQGLEGGTDIHTEIEYTSFYLQTGISRIFWAKKKYALNLSLNFQLKSTITKDGESSDYTPYNAGDYDGGFEETALFIGIGPMIQLE